MAIKALNSVAGFSVGEVPSNVIFANGDFAASNLVVTGKSNLNSNSNVYISGGSAGQVLSTDGFGNLSWTTVSTGSLSNGTSNVQVLNSSNITFSSAGTANVVVITNTGMIVDGVLSVTGNANVGNLGVTGIYSSTISASGNANVGNLGTTGVYATTLSASGNANVGNLGTTGDIIANNVTVNLALNGNTANFTGNLSAGNANLGNLATANFINVSSNLNVTNTANVGNLRTDNLLYANGAPWDLGGNPGGSNTQVQYNDGTGNFGGSANFAFDYATNNLSLNGNVLLGSTSQNQIVNNSNVSLEIRGGLNNPNGTVALAAGDYGNGVNWGKIFISGNIAGNATGQIEANIVNFQPGGAGANIVKINTIAPTATSTTTGAIQVAGGIGVTGDGYFGGNLSVAGNIANANNVSVTNTLSAVTGNFSGNITSLNANLGNLATANYINVANDLSVIGNVNAGNLIGTLANGNSNVRIFANANIEISSNGVSNVVTVTGTGLAVAGNIQSTTGNILSNGNVTANGFLNGANANVTGQIEAGSVLTANITAPSGNITIYAAGTDKSINLVPTGNGVVDVANTKITNLEDPTNPQDAATKKYVDDVAQGLNIHDSCYAATGNTLTNLTVGGTITYNNGTGGVGANLVLSGSYSKDYTTANTFDGNTTAIVGSRILVKNEANAVHNGIYVVDSATVLTRATDFNSVPEVEAGDFTFVTAGDSYNDTGWVQTEAVTTIGTDPINFTQFSGAGTYTAGSGLTLTGTVFSVNVDNVTTAISNGNVIVKSGANLTTPNLGDATFSSLSWNNLSNGNVTANNLSIGNIANITLDLTVGGNIQANGTISSNANVSGANLTTAGNVSATGNVTANIAFVSNANVSGTTITNALTVNNAISGNTANFSGNIVMANATVNLELSGNTANFTGNVQVNNLDVNLELSGNTANFTGNVAALGIKTDNYYYANGSPVDFQQAAGSNTQIQFNNNNDFGASANLTFNSATNVLGVTGDANISNAVILGNSTTTWSTVTTSAITANQTIASFSTTGITGIEYLVKGVDATGSKYSVATVQAVTDGSTVDYSTFATVSIGGSTGTLAVNISGGFVRLQVTPSSSNSTVWTTQYRLI